MAGLQLRQKANTLDIHFLFSGKPDSSHQHLLIVEMEESGEAEN